MKNLLRQLTFLFVLLNIFFLSNSSANEVRIIQHKDIQVDQKHLNSFLFIKNNDVESFFETLPTQSLPKKDLSQIKITFQYESIVNNQIKQMSETKSFDSLDLSKPFFPLFDNKNLTAGKKLQIQSENIFEHICREIFASNLPIHVSINGWLKAAQIRKLTVDSIEELDYPINLLNTDDSIKIKRIKVRFYSDNKSKMYGQINNYNSSNTQIENDELRFLYIDIMNHPILGLKVLKISYDYTFWIKEKNKRIISREGILFEITKIGQQKDIY